MDPRHRPYDGSVQVPRPPYHDTIRQNMHPPQYGQEQSERPHYPSDGPPPPPAPPPHHDRYYHQRHKTLDNMPGPPHRADHRPTLSYPPPYVPQQDQYRRDIPVASPDLRGGYGHKRTHEQAMSADVHTYRAKDFPYSHESHASVPAPAPGSGSQQPLYSLQHTAGPSHHPPPPLPPPLQHAPDHQQLGNGSMYQPPPSRSPPPPSPYSNRPMLPPESPHYASPQYGPPGPPQQGPLPPPFSRDAGPLNHRPGSGMSISAMLDHGPSRPPHDQRYQHVNGPSLNGSPHYLEKDGSRGTPHTHEHRSLTPDAYRSRHPDYNRPSRAYSGGEAHGRPMISPEKMTFGPPLPPAPLEGHPDVRPGGLPPHNSAPQSRRASVTAVGPNGPERPSTGHVHAPYQPQGPPAVDHVGVPRPPPPPLHGPPEHGSREGIMYGPPGPPEHRPWDDRGPPYREELQGRPDYPYFANGQQQQSQPQHLPQYGPASRPPELIRGPEESPVHMNGHSHSDHLPIYGPAPNPVPSASAPPAPEQGPRLPFAAEGRKLSVDALQQARLESPLLRHRHLMDRTNSTGSGRLSVVGDKRRAPSPLPQAVQGAQGQPKGPASEPSIKGEFGRPFSGLGGVTPTPTPVELATKRYASPVAERDIDAERRASGTPLIGRIDLADKQGRAASRTGKRNRKARDDDGMSSPTLELARTLSGKGPKRSRNSYIGVDSTSPILGRSDPAVPWAAGSARPRSFTPSSYAALSASKRAAQSDREHQRALERDREREERRPKTIITSKLVVDSVKNKTRKHLGSMLYDIRIVPEEIGLGEEGSRFGYDSKPEILPHFEEKDNCTFTVRVGRRFLTPRYREEVVERRNVWGTEVFSDDSDVLAAAIHAGWIRGEWGEDVDISMLNLNGPQDNEYRPNGRSSLSVSVSPELSRKSLVNGSRSVNGASASPSKDAVGANNDSDLDILTAPPKTGPVVPPANVDAHITVLLLPRLQSYAGMVSHGIKSRPWGKAAGTTPHDGVSFMIHKIEWVAEGPGSRRTERGAEARHKRIQQGNKDRMGIGRGFNFKETLAKGDSNSNGENSAKQPNGLNAAQTVAVGA